MAEAPSFDIYENSAVFFPKAERAVALRILKGVNRINIALIADDNKKELMVNFCIAYLPLLRKHSLFATGTTGSIVSEATGLSIQKLAPGLLGGEQQIGARIALNEFDMLIFFRDPLSAAEYGQDMYDLLRLCDMHNIPFATNIATAEILVKGLERGDLDWRELLRD